MHSASCLFECVCNGATAVDFSSFLSSSSDNTSALEGYLSARSDSEEIVQMNSAHFLVVSVFSLSPDRLWLPRKTKSSWRAALLLQPPAGDGPRPRKHQSWAQLLDRRGQATEANPAAPRHTAEIQTDTRTHTHTHRQKQLNFACISDEGSVGHAPFHKMTGQSYQEQRPEKFYSTVMKLHKNTALVGWKKSLSLTGYFSLPVCGLLIWNKSYKQWEKKKLCFEALISPSCIHLCVLLLLQITN